MMTPEQLDQVEDNLEWAFGHVQAARLALESGNTDLLPTLREEMRDGLSRALAALTLPPAVAHTRP